MRTYNLIVTGTLQATVDRSAENVCAGRTDWGFCAVHPKTDLKVRVEVTTRALNDQGFVLDHNKVKTVVSDDAIGVVSFSCENIGEAMISNIRELFRGDEGRLESIKITLTQWNGDGVEVTYEAQLKGNQDSLTGKTKIIIFMEVRLLLLVFKEFL